MSVPEFWYPCGPYVNQCFTGRDLWAMLPCVGHTQDTLLAGISQRYFVTLPRLKFSGLRRRVINQQPSRTSQKTWTFGNTAARTSKPRNVKIFNFYLELFFIFTTAVIFDVITSFFSGYIVGVGRVRTVIRALSHMTSQLGCSAHNIP